MKKWIRLMSGACSAAVVAALALSLAVSAFLPDCYYVVQGESLTIHSALGIRAGGLAQSMPVSLTSRVGNNYKADLTLPGGVLVKTVDVRVVSREMVIPSGQPFGIKMFTEGVMVVGLSDIDAGGSTVNPAKSAGIKTGDIITQINGEKVRFNEDVERILNASGGHPVAVTMTRSGVTRSLSLTPIPQSGGYRAGMWVRDSSAGIGTMTYYSPSTGVFAGLGHAVCDVDTGELMPLASGEAVDVTITGVNRGLSGFPGELKGMFTGARVLGTLNLNHESGIYGVCPQPPIASEPVALALRSEITTGPAVVYTTVKGRQPEAYNIVIDRINAGEGNPTKNMTIRITDPRLLDVTGGIVQGMSGSPILQNGRLVGAVTHVFVNDPTRGYAIFAENMQHAANQVNSSSKSAA